MYNLYDVSLYIYITIYIYIFRCVLTYKCVRSKCNVHEYKLMHSAHIFAGGL